MKTQIVPARSFKKMDQRIKFSFRVCAQQGFPALFHCPLPKFTGFASCKGMRCLSALPPRFPSSRICLADCIYILIRLKHRGYETVKNRDGRRIGSRVPSSQKFHYHGGATSQTPSYWNCLHRTAPFQSETALGSPCCGTHMTHIYAHTVSHCARGSPVRHVPIESVSL